MAAEMMAGPERVAGSTLDFGEEGGELSRVEGSSRAKPSTVERARWEKPAEGRETGVRGSAEWERKLAAPFPPPC